MRKVEFFEADGTSLGVVDWDGTKDVSFIAPKPCVVDSFSVDGGPRIPVVAALAYDETLQIIPLGVALSSS